MRRAHYPCTPAFNEAAVREFRQWMYRADVEARDFLGLWIAGGEL